MWKTYPYIYECSCSTEEEFEIVKFIENNAPFSMLLGKTWIEKDLTRRKEEPLEQKKQ